MSTTEITTTATETAVLEALVSHVPITLGLNDIQNYVFHNAGITDAVLPVLVKLEGMGLVVSHRHKSWRPVGAGYLIGAAK